MAYTDNESNAIHIQLEELEEVDSLTLEAKKRVTDIRCKFMGEVDDLPYINRATIALFWKGEVLAHFSDPASPKIKSCLKKASTSNVSTARWAVATHSQIEQDLWTLWINQTASGCRSLGERMLSDCFDALKLRQSSLICLMGWLFPETKELLAAVETVAKHGDSSTWSVRDRMLFWITYMRDTDYIPEKVNDITTRILDMPLSSGAFAGTEEGNPNDDLISSAAGLLALISGARGNDPKKQAIRAVRKVARWIVEHITETIDEGVAWAYYALIEYIDLERSEKRRTTGER